jgi:hypothetical protein
MKLMRIIGMWLMHHFVRPIWYRYLFVGIAFTKYAFLYMFNPNKRADYKANLKKWNTRIKALEGLNAFFQKDYRYKFDGTFKNRKLNGAFDHHNVPLEFFMEWGDCDDQAEYSKDKLRELSKMKGKKYKPVTFGIVGTSLDGWHYDTMFELAGKYFFFNYGHNIDGKTRDECLTQLNGSRYWNNMWVIRLSCGVVSDGLNMLLVVYSGPVSSMGLFGW